MKVKVLKQKMTHDIIEQIIEVDKEFYLNFDYNSEKPWYYRRYSSKNNIFCLYVDNKIVGYFLYYKISKKLFDDILHLKYDNDYDFPESETNVKSNFYYMPSVIVSKKYRNHATPLLRELIKEGTKKKHLVVITVSKEGCRLAKNMLSFIGTVNKEKNIDVYARI